MQLNNFDLKIGKNVLLKDVNIHFDNGKVNHILGKNGVGKSVFAKKIYSIYDKVTLVGSYSNIPLDITLEELLVFLKKRFKKQDIEYLIKKLHISNINYRLLLKKMSDGQKQKIKLLTYFLFDNDIIILDEITNALDQTTVSEIYTFLNEYIKRNPNKIIINITHNLTDLRKVAGNYYIIENYNIQKVDDLERVIALYVGGEI